MTGAKLARRTFIIGAAAGGAALIGFSMVPQTPPWDGPLDDGEHALNAWIKIGTDDTVTFFCAQAEMGQGIHSGFAMVLADEMDADWDKVQVVQAPNHPVYSNLEFARQAAGLPDGLPGFLNDMATWAIKEYALRAGVIATGGSTSMRDKYQRLREAGALARMALVQAAADRWSVPVVECVAASGIVTHEASGQSASYGALAQAASRVELSPPITLKPASQQRYIGKKVDRKDVPSKVDGSAIYGADVRPEGLVYAAVVNGFGSLGHIVFGDDSRMRETPGFIGMVDGGNWVGVVADTYWQAEKALAALPMERVGREGSVMVNDWQEERLFNAIERGLPSVVLRDEAASSRRDANADVQISAQYFVPHLTHKALETNTATAHWDDGKLTIWAPTQSATIALMALSKSLDIDRSDITINTTFVGGGFGRKVEPDAILQAAILAQRAQRPVQVIWSRKEDIFGDVFRPAAAARLTGALTAEGKIAKLDVHLASQSVGASFKKRWMGGDGEYDEDDPSVAEGLDTLPYDTGAYTLRYSDFASPARIGYWRSVGHSYTAYFLECFIDELARSAAIDPLEFRLQNASSARAKPVLERLAEISGYRDRVPVGRFQGIAYHECFGSAVGSVAEIAPLRGNLKSRQQSIQITRLFSVIACGKAVSPDAVRAQMEGGALFGLDAVLNGNTRFDMGMPTAENFDTDPILDLAAAPDVFVEIVEDDGPLGGVGEPGVPTIAPAVANAMFAWRGKPVRQLPLSAGLKGDFEIKSEGV